MRHRVEQRADSIFTYLHKRLNRPVRYQQVIEALGLEAGATTQRAFRRAREIARAKGLHLRHAVPHNGFTVMVTDDPGNALDSALHMDRIASGVRKANEPAWEFMRNNRQDFTDPADRAAFSKAYRLNKAVAELLDAADDAISALVQQRKGDAA